MTAARCADCGVLLGAVHHALCGFQHELSPEGKLVRVRMSAAPCEWCGLYFKLRGTQKHHTQSAECYGKVIAAQRSEYKQRPETRRKNRERWNNLPPEQKRNCRRARDSRRAAEQARKRAQREAETAVFRHVEKPLALAAAMSRKYYWWLKKMDRDDFEQTIFLALVDAQINPFEGAYIDTHRMQIFVYRHLDRLQRNSGFRRTQYGIPTLVGIDDFALASQQNWAATWANV